MARDRERFGILNHPAAGGAREAQHLFHQELEPAALLLDEHAVSLHLGRIGGEFAAQIIGRGVDDGERRAQLVRDAGNKIHLKVGKSLGAARVGDERAHARHHQQQHAGSHRQVAPAQLRDYGFERPGAMTREHLPASRISWTAPSRSAAAPAGSGPAAEYLIVRRFKQAY